MPPSVHVELWAERDRRWAQRLYRFSQRRVLLPVLHAASWLGDGVLWYGLIIALALIGGTEGRDVAAHMMLAALLNLAVYLWLKRRIGRARPYVNCPGIRLGGRALDQFSFPSGHALHATTFSMLLIRAYPESAIVLVPLCLLIAWSRIALGLHYPSDVAAGALMGALTGSLLLALY